MADGCPTGAVVFQAPEVALDLIGIEHGNLTVSDGLFDVFLPQLLIVPDGRRAQVLPAVPLPRRDGFVDSGGVAPSHCGFHGGGVPSYLAARRVSSLSGSPPPPPKDRCWFRAPPCPPPPR